MNKKWSYLRTGICSIALWGATSVWAIPMISVSPSTSTLNPGDSFSVDILISENPSPTAQGFEFDLDFDSSVLMATGISEGTFLDDFFGTQVLESDILGGDVNFAVVGLGFGFPTNDFNNPLATITFDVLTSAAPGDTLLDLNDVVLSDPFGLEIRGIELTDGTVTIAGTTPMPEPSMLLLLGAGLAGLGLSRRRKSK